MHYALQELPSSPARCRREAERLWMIWDPPDPLRNTGDDDVAIKVLYCGICHSDLHTIKNDWRNAIYPVVPG
ncbi:hypothetical protein QYE76_047931 [Lolium multiflorum]|uniref:Alcohol dehydrogenase-like N-terminal domain-containing protein n=1 Tax=Lolium multiflorum TaxID=4521 RepID=A0AAD8TST8_LOLMU|nr:hypothetical protein QYE76_047931 [Lolium multiflorum]